MDHLHTGRRVGVDEKLRTRRWQDEGGQTWYVTELHADMVELLNGRRLRRRGSSLTQARSRPLPGVRATATAVTGSVGREGKLSLASIGCGPARVASGSRWSSYQFSVSVRASGNYLLQRHRLPHSRSVGKDGFIQYGTHGGTSAFGPVVAVRRF